MDPVRVSRCLCVLAAAPTIFPYSLSLPLSLTHSLSLSLSLFPRMLLSLMLACGLEETTCLTSTTSSASTSGVCVSE